MKRRVVWALWIALWALIGFAPMAASAPKKKKKGSGETITWMNDLPKALERSTTEQRVLMICINARSPIGEPEEPAAKGLREIVYKDPAVVKKSRQFICVLLTQQGSSADYGELAARFGIDGLIVSPQHIFVQPGHKEGQRPLLRKQYWGHGSGKEGVKQMLAMMDRALERFADHEGVPELPLTDDGELVVGADREAWIKRLLDIIERADQGVRRKALAALVEHDQKGDCTTPLVPLITKLNEEGNVAVLSDVVRAVGIPDFRAAAPAVQATLQHKDAGVRGYAAVTLEYIGCPTSVAPLLARAKREKNEAVINHLYRAVGRCGVGNVTARKKLLRQALPGKGNDFTRFGAVLGLAYFEGDAAVARGLEKHLLKLGSPLQTGTNTHTFLRAAIAWCLSEVKDPKTAKFLRKRVIAPIADSKSPWKDSVLWYYKAIADKCDGKEGTQPAINAGIANALWTDNARALVDEFRLGRDMSQFTPKGEWGHPSEDE